jgi:LysR family transcriptional regulator, low CO2-responsive transcriptional regulator
MLGLQDITVPEVGAAGRGRRLLRVGGSSLFAEHAALGLIELSEPSVHVTLWS